jgi:hypothetical protein
MGYVKRHLPIQFVGNKKSSQDWKLINALLTHFCSLLVMNVTGGHN